MRKSLCFAAVLALAAMTASSMVGGAGAFAAAHPAARRRPAGRLTARLPHRYARPARFSRRYAPAGHAARRYTRPLGTQRRSAPAVRFPRRYGRLTPAGRRFAQPARWVRRPARTARPVRRKAARLVGRHARAAYLNRRNSPPLTRSPRAVLAVKPLPAVASGHWGASEEWRMAGANAGHTAAVTCALKTPLRPAWRLSAAELGAPLNEPAYLHPRIAAGGMVILEMDTPEKISLVGIDGATGRLRWKRAFPTPQLFDDAGVYPACDGAGIGLFVNQGPAHGGTGGQWGLYRLGLTDGRLQWQTGPLTLSAALKAPRGSHTLFRPVVASSSLFLVAPDFFGRPPLLAFSAGSGTLQWRSDHTGGDIPTVLESGPLAPLVVSAGYAAGRPLVRTTLLLDGSQGPARAAEPAGQGVDWGVGVWDSQVGWADPATGLCCVDLKRLRSDTSWPTRACVLSMPGAAHTVDWGQPGANSLSGPVEKGALYVGRRVLYQGKTVPALWRQDLLTGHTDWAVRGDDAGTPLAATPDVIVGKGQNGEIDAWSSANGEILWQSTTTGLEDCIVGDGAIVASYAHANPTGATSYLAEYH